MKDKEYVVQEKVGHGKTLVPECDQDGCASTSYYNFIIGAYVINGKCRSLEAKISNSFQINVSNDAARTPIFSVTE